MNTDLLINDKSELVARLIDRPEEFTDEQIEQILADEQCRELYDVAVTAASVLLPPVEADLEAEWQRVQAAARPRPRFAWWKAAVAIAVLLAGSFAYAAVRDYRAQVQQRQETMVTGAAAPVAKSEVAASVKDTVADQPATAAGTRVFDNWTIEQIAAELAQRYGLQVKVENPEAGAVRLYYECDGNLPLERVLEQLNTFEHVNINLQGETLIIQ